MNSTVVDILRATFDPHELVSQLGRNGHQAKELLQDRLIQFLQDAAIRYSPQKKGHDQKHALIELHPCVGDVVFFLNSEKKKCFGLIVAILKDNQVLVRRKYQGTITEQNLHVRVLTLIYRPSEWNHDIPL